ncbi:MAG: PAS domain-containing protein, partial [Actinomycetota bacterium]
MNEYETEAADAWTAQGGFFASGVEGSDVPLEARYRHLEARYRDLIDRLPAVIYLDGVGDHGSMVDISPTIEQLLGITPDGWRGRLRGWEATVHPDDLERVVAESERSATMGEPFHVEYRAFHRDGRLRWIREDSILISGDDGAPRYWLGLMLDVTDSVRTEHELVEAQTKYGALVEHIPAIVYVDVADEQMTTTYVSPQIEALLGITSAEYIDDPDLWLTHLHPDDRDGTVAAYLEGRKAGDPFTLEYRLI